ncbi:MAG: glycoside hydrolase family 3 N-terminal domain-containing protein [Silvibacterium sp.]
MKRRWLLRLRLILFCVFISSALFACYGAQRHSAAGALWEAPRDHKAWVEQTLKQLTLEEKVGQMLQIRVYGDYQAFTEPDYAIIRDQIQKYHIGSVDLDARMFGPNLVKGTPVQVATVLNRLQHDSELPLLVGADIERGLASRVSDTPEFPFPMGFGATGDPTLVEKFGAIVAEEARAVGIDWAYAPVADVNSNPENPIINDRAFGEDPHAVAELVAAYIRGVHEGGMLVAVKHFPGEGDTSSDPHVRITRIDADQEHFDHFELPPFRSAIQAGADSVMVAQVPGHPFAAFAKGWERAALQVFSYHGWLQSKYI